jgi:cobalamin biosynthesis protein CobW
MQAKIPATVITGFLGAGKTTLISHLLGHAAGRRIALVINEFGDIGVDADLIRGCGVAGCAEAEITELANGCICCTVAEDFIPAMQAILSRDPRPDHIVIETSGLALPQPLVRAFNWPEIAAEVTVDGVITVVDAAALAAGRLAADEAAVEASRRADPMLDHETPLGELFADQLIAADMVVFAKTDLVAGSRLAQIETEIASRLRQGVAMVRVRHGAVDSAALLGLGIGSEADVAARPSRHEADHGGEGHEHDDFDTLALHLPPSRDRSALIETIEGAIARYDILRLKGFAALDGAPARLTVQAVGPRIETWFERPWGLGEARHTALVVIGLSPLDRDGIVATFGAPAP